MYTVIFICVLAFLIAFRNAHWNNWMSIALSLITITLLGISIETGFGSPLAINHKKPERGKMMQFYSEEDFNSNYSEPVIVAEQRPDKPWTWWELSFEFFCLTVISIPFSFHDEWTRTWDHIMEQWQLRSERIRRRREQLVRDHGTPAPGGGGHVTGFWAFFEKFLPVEVAGEILGEGFIHLFSQIFRR